jgi:elongation factor Tu
MDVEAAGCVNRARVIQWANNGGANQKSWFAPVGDGVNYYLPANHSGRVLDVSGGPAATNNGAPLNQWSALRGANQKWKISATPDGFLS